MSYVPVNQNQPDSYCCVPTTASMAIDGATAGVRRPSVHALRSATGVPHPYGISYIGIAAAARKVAGITLDPRYGLTRSDVVKLAPAGRLFGISVEMRLIGYSRYGGHTIYVHAYSVHPGVVPCDCEKRSTVKHSEFTIQDPGTWTVGYKQISADRLFRAAEARTGNRGINVLVAPDRTWVYRRAVRTGWIRAKPTGASARVTAIVPLRKYLVAGIVKGSRYYVNGHYSTGWYRVANGYIRGDKLGTTNV